MGTPLHTVTLTPPQHVIESPWQLEYGFAAHALSRLTVDRPDLEVHIKGGQLRVGYTGESWGYCDVVVGTLGVELQSTDYDRAQVYAAGLPRRPERTWYAK